MAKVSKSKSSSLKCAAKARSKRGRHCQWTEAMMASAVAAVRDQGMSQRAACKAFNVPRCTLQMRLVGKTEEGTKPGRPTMLSQEQEQKLVNYACNRAAMGIGFSRPQFMKYAGNLAHKHKVYFKRGQPSKRWWRAMKNRHEQLKLRQPEGTAAVRHQCMDMYKVSRYFEAVKKTLDDCSLQYKPENIWNMDETGVQFDYKPGKVVAAKGVKYLHSRTSGNRETITIICAINAAGKSLPPHLIVKGQTRRSLNSLQTENAPEGTTWSWSDSGWTKQGIALLWFKNSFLPYIGEERPQILIVDGHDSHNFIELIDVAVENNVHIIELPAHTSHWLQPCDRTVFGPFKNAYRKACADLTTLFPGSVVSKSNFCGLLKKAWEEAVTPSNIVSGFRACGIFPFNARAIPSEAYFPNSLYAERESVDTDVAVINAVSTVVAPNIASTQVQQSQLLQCSSAPLSHPTTNTGTAEVAGPSSSTHDSQVISATPELALVLMESSLSAEQLECFNFCFGKGYDLVKDDLFMTWKTLKQLSATTVADLLNDMSSLPLQTDADVSVTSESVLPQLDVSVTDLLVDNLDNLNQIEQSSAQQDTTAAAAVIPELCIEQTQLKEELLPTDRDDIAGSLSVNSLPAAIDHKQFPFCNSSHPGDSDSDVLPYPAQICRKSKNHTKKKYFILTSKEARAAKLQEIQNKLNREASKKAKAEASIRKRQEKIEKVNTKPKNKKPAKRQNKDTAASKVKTTRQKPSKQNDRKQNENQDTTDTVPCSVCYIRFCDDTSGRKWIQCQECDLWYHNECQGLDETGIATFICIQCDE